MDRGAWRATVHGVAKSLCCEGPEHGAPGLYPGGASELHLESIVAI